MIKVLHIFASLNTGGVESFVMNLQKALEKDDVQFDFLLRSKQNDIDKIKYFHENGSKIYITDSWPQHMIHNHMQMKQFFNKHGQEYDFIHVHANALIYILPVLFAEKYTAIRIILHSHNTSTKEKWMQHIHNINKLRIKRYQIIKLACSLEAGKWMFGKGYQVIPNGIDTDRFKTTKEDLYKKDRKVFIMVSVGRLVRQKNYSFMFPVINGLIELGVNVHYYIAGEGEQRICLEKQIQDGGLCEHVTFLGNMERIEELLKQAHVFLMPSLFEGFSVALLEAQSSGIPCVVSDYIAPESVLCGNVYRIALSTELWIEKIKDIAEDENHRFNEKNNNRIKSSSYGLDGLRQVMKNIYKI